MERLKKKILLEFLDADSLDDSFADNISADIDEPIDEEPVEETSGNLLSERQFIILLLNDLSDSVLDIFDTLTTYVLSPEFDRDSTEPAQIHVSDSNIDLITGIYEDISTILGKIQQGIKDNSPENIQNAIDDGQTSAQDTLIDSEEDEEEEE